MVMKKTGDIKQPEVQLFDIEEKKFVKQEVVVKKMASRKICPSCGRNITVDANTTQCPLCKCDLKGRV